MALLNRITNFSFAFLVNLRIVKHSISSGFNFNLKITCSALFYTALKSSSDTAPSSKPPTMGYTLLTLDSADPIDGFRSPRRLTWFRCAMLNVVYASDALDIFTTG